MPAIVLVAESDQLEPVWHQAQRPFEVSVEAETGRRSRQREPGVVGEDRLDQVEAFRIGAVVADKTVPLDSGLIPDRLDLGPQKAGLAFFQMLARTAATTNVLLLFPFLVYLVLAPLALTLSLLEGIVGEERSPATISPLPHRPC